MIKPGDKISRIDGDTFSNGNHIVTVNTIFSNLSRVWIKETGTHVLLNVITKVGDTSVFEYDDKEVI